ncbi:SusC/RagA family TonB-linked outer membrane protein [Chitinophaga agrisoli]|uniref:SusC/RagA family TonB-linked outer membrane protein n=2 Tax=Chitinophaga agrisoli TaxID=2607653 RepID=A0A5B2W5G6_9BACT|nr:SusC/RagA family TonB-linked outer membrane protein [Chitinophaga agrisoli]
MFFSAKTAESGPIAITPRYGYPSAAYLKRLKQCMRISILSVFLMSCSFQVLLAHNSMGQTLNDVTVQLELKHQTLIKALKKLQQLTPFTFAYNRRALADITDVSLPQGTRTLKETLSLLLKDQPLVYEQIGSNIVISPLLIVRSDSASALPDISLVMRQYDIHGTVKSTRGEPLPGVTIVIRGTKTGTITDAYGRFKLNVSSDKKVSLECSAIGYETQIIEAGDQRELNVVMHDKAVGLNETVVVGYGTLNRREVTSAITHVSDKELLAVGGNNPLMSLQGKVAGLTISNPGTADPNSNPTIQLRGISSRNAGLGPLIVVDGVPGGNLENINQNDIAAIDVLKDGAASAIYGTRGSNGVIMITTKKGGRGNGPQVTYNGYAAFDIPTRMLKSLSADEFLKNNRGTDFGAKTDWAKEISRQAAFSQKHSLSFSGGDARNNYRATIDYRKAEGIDIRSGRQEYGGRVSLNHTSKNELWNMGFNIAPRYFKRNDADYGAFNMALSLNPTEPVFSPQNPDRYFMAEGWEAYNPVERLKTELSGSEVKFLEMNATVKLNILPNLSTQITLGQQTRDYFDFFFRPSTSTYAAKNEGGQSSANRKYDKNDQKTFEWTGSYALTRSRHSIKALAGYSYQYFQYSELFGENRGFTSDAFTYNNLGNGIYQQVEGRNGMTSTKNDSRLIAFFGRLNYSYNDKYLATASLRYEGSSKFGFNNKWGYFPAVSLGWRISSEQFMQTVTWIDELKLRGDFGVTGNQDFGNYLSLDLYSGYGYYPINGSYYQVWGPGQNINYNLRWEKAHNWNAGLDFVLFHNVFSGSINYYQRKQQDLLGNYNVPIPPNIQTQTYANVGSMQNSGIELQLSVAAVNRKDFTYTASFAGASNNNRFVSFSNDQYHGQGFIDVVNLPAPGSPGTAQRLQEGERIGNFYMWKYAGVDNQGNFLVYDKSGKPIPSTQANNDDKQIVGNGLPRFTASLGNTFTYKKWDASVYFRGAFGYDIFNVHDFYYGLQSVQANTNVLTSAYGRNAHITGPNSLAFLNDYFIEKGDYVKLDVITLGYTINSRSKYFESLRLYATGRNLATFTGFKGVDPEAYPVNGLYPGILTNTDGAGSKNYYPSTMQLLVGLQLNF